MLLWIFGPFSSASAVKEEITGKTYDFFRMLPLSAYQKTTGILIGKNLIVLFLGAINCLFLIFFGSAGGLSANLQIQVLFVLFSVMILANSIALLSSINPSQKTKTNNVLAVIILIYCLCPIFIVPFFISQETMELETITAWFFAIELPLLILASLIALYFSCWAIKGILRKFTREDEPLFTRKGALLFMLGFEFILLGLFYHYLGKEETEISYTYWMLSLLVAFAIPFGAIRTFDRYLEYIGLMREQSGLKLNSISRILLHSNISLVFGLSNMELLRGLYRIWIVFTFYIFLTLLLELDTVYRPLSKKIRFLLGFIAAVYVVLPPILAAILESEAISVYSPCGFFWAIVEEPYIDMPSLTSVWGSNIILSVIPIILISKRYIHILKLRQKM
ncbi:MAG: hypothetical protein ACYS67_09620 [Planctomycetota bacterium]|jgi:hypothetical protein